MCLPVFAAATRRSVCLTKNAGICIDLIKHFYTLKPILGVCLGHQCIGEAFGASIIKCEQIKHGKTSQINHDASSIFQNVKNPYHVMRYHVIIVYRITVCRILYHGVMV